MPDVPGDLALERNEDGEDGGNAVRVMPGPCEVPGWKLEDGPGGRSNSPGV